MIDKAKHEPADKGPDEKKAAEVISVPKISPDEWVHLFETTGLCQAYDLESEHPTPAGIPLFIVQRGRHDQEGRPFPEKPAFIVDDKIRKVEEETYTERRKYLAESGFSSADLAVVVPYVQASVQSSKLEKEQSEQDVTSKQIDEYNKRKAKVKRLKQAVQEAFFKTPLETLLSRYESDVAQEILNERYKEYMASQRKWKEQTKAREAQEKANMEAPQKSKVTGDGDRAGPSPPLLVPSRKSKIPEGSGQENEAESFAEGANPVTGKAGATSSSGGTTIWDAGAANHSGRCVVAAQSALKREGALSEMVDPGPSMSALPVGRLGKEEPISAGADDEDNKHDMEETGANLPDDVNAVVPENGGGGAPAGEGQKRFARLLSGVRSFWG
ncbi:hypothetical protein KFL_010550010, partial [Klebsormidium nitens]